jgi:hypothetical protein
MGYSVTLDGSGFIVSPHAMLLPANMLYQRDDLPNSAYLETDDWIGHVSEYTIAPNAVFLSDFHAPFGTRTPSRRVISRDFRTRSSGAKANRKYGWGALQFDCPFDGLGTGMPITFAKDALNRGLASIGGYRQYENHARHYVPAKTSRWANDLKNPYSNWYLDAENEIDLTGTLAGAGAWKSYVDIDYGSGLIQTDYGLLGIFTSAVSSDSDNCSYCCRAFGPRFTDVGGRADSIREIMRWTPDADCDESVALPWHVLFEHVRGQQPEMLIPLEQLNLIEDIDDSFNRPVAHTMQVIEHTFYEWEVHALEQADPTSPRAIRLIEPVERWLSVDEAQALLSASINWMTFNPPVSTPTDIQVDPTIPAFNSMIIEEDPIEDEEQDENDDHVEEMLLDSGEQDEPQFDTADLNQDGSVDGADLATLLGEWGNEDSAADLNGNGFVEGADLAVLLGRWR